MRRPLFALLIVAVLVSALVTPVAASPDHQTVSYVVRPNDTLASIARQFCTTWQEIYRINQSVIGPNPNVLRSGTVLQVPNRCGGQPPAPGGCNLGPIPHAMGPLNGNVYTVVAGDTLFSIARRFCTTTQQLASANGIPQPARIFVGQRLTVPVGTTTPTPQPPQPQRFLTMSFPTNGAVLSSPWTATGTGGGLFEGNVVVTAFTNAGVQIAQQATILQGANVGTGGAGNWSATLTTNVAAGTTGLCDRLVAPVQRAAGAGQCDLWPAAGQRIDCHHQPIGQHPAAAHLQRVRNCQRRAAGRGGGAGAQPGRLGAVCRNLGGGGGRRRLLGSHADGEHGRQRADRSLLDAERQRAHQHAGALQRNLAFQLSTALRRFRVKIGSKCRASKRNSYHHDKQPNFFP
jgi:LysM repeat protein